MSIVVMMGIQQYLGPTFKTNREKRIMERERTKTKEGKTHNKTRILLSQILPRYPYQSRPRDGQRRQRKTRTARGNGDSRS